MIRGHCFTEVLFLVLVSSIVDDIDLFINLDDSVVMYPIYMD